MKIIAFIVLLLLLATATATASTVVLSWDQVSDADLQGYRVYYANTATLPFKGTGAKEGASGAVTVPKGTQTATLSGLDNSKPYYFAVTAYTTAGMESDYSNIVMVPKFPSIPANLRSVTIIVSP